MEAKKAVLATLAYADVFHYPLSFSEIFRYLISEKKFPENILKKTLCAIPNVFEKDGLYCFSDRTMLTKVRQVRDKASKEKMKKAKRVTKLISLLPTISLIGISGAVAMGNATADDDIDFFIITKTNTLWFTRFFIRMLLTLVGSARTRNNACVRDKVCLNMMLDESALSFPKARQSLYVAHEIVQMKPIFVRNNMYQLFLASNRWVKQYMPHAIDIKKKESRAPSISISQYLNIYSIPLEFLAQKFQLWYMKARTREIVTRHFLAFHPRDYEYEIMEAYKRRIKKYGAL